MWNIWSVVPPYSSQVLSLLGRPRYRFGAHCCTSGEPDTSTTSHLPDLADCRWCEEARGKSRSSRNLQFASNEQKLCQRGVTIARQI